MENGLVAIIDDDPLVRAATSNLLRSAGYRCRAFASASELLETDIATYDCVLSDVQMPVISGLELAPAIRRRAGHVPVILMTAYRDERATGLIAAGIVAELLDKPLDGILLFAAVDRAVSARRASSPS